MENNLLNDYKACVSHGYLSELDDKATVREKLLNMTGPDPFSSVTGGYASHHKVQSVAQFVADPKKYKQNYYISSSGTQQDRLHTAHHAFHHSLVLCPVLLL